MRTNRACIPAAVMFVFAFFLTSRAHAVAFGGVVPGAGVVQVHLRTLRGERFVHIVRQHTDFSCGAAALATILRYGYDRGVTEQEVLQGLFRVSNPEVVREKGFSLMDLKRYVATIGLRGVGFRIRTGALYRLKVPVIVLLDISGYEHFVVLRRVLADRVYVADPALGERVMPLDRFLHDWDHIIFAVVGNGFDPRTLLLRPRAPVAVSDQGAREAMVNAQLIEFGFQNAGMF
ncbi:MAG: C39 family peptidase [Acidiferrobacteraceae bacterium]